MAPFVTPANTAKLHELDPQTYLADVLERIVSGQTKVNALSELQARPAGHPERA